jgi:hypothetical protein
VSIALYVVLGLCVSLIILHCSLSMFVHFTLMTAMCCFIVSLCSARVNDDQCATALMTLMLLLIMTNYLLLITNYFNIIVVVMMNTVSTLLQSPYHFWGFVCSEASKNS